MRSRIKRWLDILVGHSTRSPAIAGFFHFCSKSVAKSITFFLCIDNKLNTFTFHKFHIVIQYKSFSFLWFKAIEIDS